MTSPTDTPPARRLAPVIRLADGHLLIVLVVFWSVATLLTLVLDWAAFSAHPGMLVRLVPASAAGAFLSYLLAEFIRRARPRRRIERIAAIAAMTALIALIYSVVKLIFLADDSNPDFQRGMLTGMGHQWLLEIGVFAAWCGTVLLLDLNRESGGDTVRQRSSRMHRVLDTAGLPAPLLTAPNDGMGLSVFWRLQVIFWSCNLLFTFLSSIAVVEEVSNLWRNIVIETGGMAATSLIHFAVLRPTRQLDLPIRFVLALGSSMLATCFYIVVMWLMWFEVFPAGYTVGQMTTRGWEGLTAIAPRWFVFNMPAFIAWSAIYLVLEAFGRIRAQERQIYDSAVLAQEAQLKMLRFQLNPHFLFNTINAISSLVIDNRNDEAETMLGRLSSFLRFALQTSPDERVTLDDELQAQALYLDIEKARFDSRLEVERAIDPGVRDALLPSLILQPVLENSVKYAVSRSRTQVTIRIEARRDQDDLVISITDSGGPLMPAREPGTGTGVGLTNIRARLDVLYGKRARLDAGPLAGGGFAVRIRLPFEATNENSDKDRGGKDANSDR